ncbi:MAG: DEAD/DEAH box helicase, partial [Bdellovibrionales bacterium]|nr:DEAD/DEAH box helicase [Bdellovibrionales bacterium]
MNEIGVKQVAERIHTRLQRYLEAQYHIKDPGFIEERRRLLREPGAISQRPYVEVTPSYAVLDGFETLRLPVAVRNLLVELSGWKPAIGVYPPYRHQADALEAYFSEGEDGSDLIVATGTGSGKTETFLYSVLGALAMEGTHRPESYATSGVRALLLYPMNALVSDQTSRLRKLFGDERLSGLFSKRFGRHPRFGMYTSRTPYPGVRSGSKDERHISTLLEYFVALEQSSKDEDRKLVGELKSRGRWPSKDVVRFFAKDQEEIGSYHSGAKSGKTRVKHNWEKRLFTQKSDRELLTRHEIQNAPPDLLVTNYSMLEYMLLRPIERSIFRDTKVWLEKHPKNQLLLILDEAHMYRGVAGAEVGLLIRRLQSRLGITREKMRCIMTSASLGSGAAAEEAGRVFAAGLTGKRTKRGFSVIRGTNEERSGASPGTEREVAAFEMVNPAMFAGVNEGKSRKVIEEVGTALGWTAPSGNLQQYVARHLTGVGPLELLLKTCAGRATAFDTVTETLFPGF